MKFLNNRKIASVVLAALIVSSALLGGHRSLNKLFKQTESVFYDGIYQDGMGIQNDLENRISLAYNMVTIARKYLPEDNKELQAVLTARDELTAADKISEKCQANRALTESTESLYSALGQQKLEETDEKYRTRIYTDLVSRDDIISHDPYNQKAAEFNRALEKFPANLLAALTGIQRAQLFQ